MNTQSEAQLENALIDQLVGLGFDRVTITDEASLIANLKVQIEKHNGVTLSDNEFKQVLNKLSRGSVFEKARTLRERLDYIRDADGKPGFLELINMVKWCKNEYQVTNQVTMTGKYENRYDVTLLVNGLPLVQIELKRRGLEMKEAFNQTVRYQKHSFGAGLGLYQYLQLFVISNGVNTKYFANNPTKQGEVADFKQTFYWADEDNKTIRNLSDFATVFLEKCQLSKMITKYVVLNESEQKLMVLRPYQYYAVESIVERVETTTKDGYIWHTTGSGKTLTSFKAAQILTQNPNVYKVVFVVDRKDLDFQTISEFNKFQKDSVDGTTNTNALVKQFSDDTPLIVTTLQKLNTAISNNRHAVKMGAVGDKRMVFIFDECHRSQFGDTHKKIREFFPNVQIFGFTGTPIFVENAAKTAMGKKTTKDLFGECLHKYVITDAIRDENVLKFSVEYIRTFKAKDNVVDIQVEAIDRKEVMDAPERLEKIVDYILANHSRKTHGREFTSIFCVSSTDALKAYYAIFKRKKEAGEHNLRLATIFSYTANEEDTDDGGLDTDVTDGGSGGNKHSRDMLEGYIADYNKMFGDNHRTGEFYKYYQDVGKRVKAKQIDILLVVNMFLTGFDSKHLNTIYVDKNLRYHGLLQAYSRTNRIYGNKKSQGNVVAFRDLKERTDEAITLFANKDAKEDIILEPYESYVEKFKEALANLYAITPTVDAVDDLLTEEDEEKFILAFRNVIRLKNVMECFTQFDLEDLGIDAQTFADFSSKYLDLRDKVKTNKDKEKASILDDIDFEAELIARDQITVSYIIALLESLRNAKPEDQAKGRKTIADMLDGDAQMRSKKELIERFIAEHFAKISSKTTVAEEFDTYWDEERRKALDAISRDENVNPDGLNGIIGEYLYSQKLPMREDVISIMNERPSLKQRKPLAERIIERVIGYVEIFIDGVD